MGVELQIIELVERQARAVVQRRDADAERIGVEIAELRAELATAIDPDPAGRPIVVHLDRVARSGQRLARRASGSTATAA